MAKYINISKHSETGNLYYYFVSGDFGPVFYIGIEPSKKIVWFYKDKDFLQKPLGFIDFNEENPIKSIESLNNIDVAMAARRASLAMLKGEFPDYIGVSS